MNIEDYVAVSGMSGLYKMVVNRDNGLIIEDLDSGKKRFASARKHQFTPLASIGIYTDDDTTELKLVFNTMLQQIADNPPVATNASKEDISAYFASILPEYDRERVYLSDIKRVIKWFNFLNGRDLLKFEEEQSEEEQSEEEQSEEEQKAEDVTEEAPAEESTKASE